MSIRVRSRRSVGRSVSGASKPELRAEQWYSRGSSAACFNAQRLPKSIDGPRAVIPGDREPAGFDLSRMRFSAFLQTLLHTSPLISRTGDNAHSKSDAERQSRRQTTSAPEFVRQPCAFTCTTVGIKRQLV